MSLSYTLSYSLALRLTPRHMHPQTPIHNPHARIKQAIVIDRAITGAIVSEMLEKFQVLAVWTLCRQPGRVPAAQEVSLTH